MIDFGQIQLYLLDMDGTIYFEDKLIDGAFEFINKLIEKNKHYIFISNNSSVNKNVYINKINKLGIKCEEKNVFSSSMAMGIFLQENYPNKRVYLVGTKSFEDELRRYKVNIVDKDAEIVVVGYDRELTYQKLIDACFYLDNGAIFLATNPDLVYPLKNKRYLPDCGSICNMLTTATGKKPLYIGKPNDFMIKILENKYNLKSENMAIIGDRLYTDMQMAINAKTKSILVLSGETDEEMYKKHNLKVDYIASSIKDLITKI